MVVENPITDSAHSGENQTKFLNLKTVASKGLSVLTKLPDSTSESPAKKRESLMCKIREVLDLQILLDQMIPFGW